MQTKKECYFCKIQKDLDVHHALTASNRKKADMDGLWVYLCRRDHRNLHDHNVGEMKLRQEAERAWLDKYRKTVDDWISRYGKNYLDAQP